MKEEIVGKNPFVLARYLGIFFENKRYVNEEISGDKPDLLYRGQSNKNYELRPSVFRDGLLGKEHILIHELLQKAPEEFFAFGDPLGRLIKMQHYGLPTRLLDVTTNPLVALYFACCDDSDKDRDGDGETYRFL